MTGGSASHRAVLIAGGVSPKQCHPRYAKNLSWWASSLVRRGFSCWVCHGDGSQHAGFGSTSFVLSTASTANVAAALIWGAEATSRLVVVGSNHGSADGLCLLGADTLTPPQLGELLGPGDSGGARRVIVMGQCSAGVFGKLADVATVVVAASADNRSSYACAPPPGPAAYDEFLYQFGTALFGAPPDAPQPGPVQPQAVGSAFVWARTKDRRPDTPLIFDPAGLASSLTI